MLYEANIYQMDVEDHVFWVAESKGLKGCVGQGDSSDEAIRELEENEKAWLHTARESGIPIPPLTIKKPKSYSGKVSLRMSPYVHEKAVEVSDSLGISLNQFINDALVEYCTKVTLSGYTPLEETVYSDTSNNSIPYSSCKNRNLFMIKEGSEE